MKKKILLVKLGEESPLEEVLSKIEGAVVTVKTDFWKTTHEKDFDAIVIEVEAYKVGYSSRREQFVSQFAMQGLGKRIIAIRTDDCRLTVIGANMTLTATAAKEHIVEWVEKIFELS